MSRDGEVIVLLSCGHIERQLRASDYMVHCWACRQRRNVMGRTGGYQVRCTDCRYSRGYGLTRLTAEGAAYRHGAAHRSHTVQLRLGPRVVRVFRAVESGEQQIIFPDDEPPF